MATREQIEAMIARCPSDPDQSTWTKSQKRDVMRLYNYWNIYQEIIDPLFDWESGEYLGKHKYYKEILDPEIIEKVFVRLEALDALKSLLDPSGKTSQIKPSKPTIEEIEDLIARCPKSPDRTSWSKGELRIVMTLFKYWWGMRNYGKYGELLSPLFVYPGGDYAGR